MRDESGGMRGPGDGNAAWVETVVEVEHGRFVVYIEVGFWETDDAAAPFQTVRHRIQAYATRQKAEVAAALMKRGAAKELREPGFEG